MSWVAFIFSAAKTQVFPKKNSAAKHNMPRLIEIRFDTGMVASSRNADTNGGSGACQTSADAAAGERPLERKDSTQGPRLAFGANIRGQPDSALFDALQHHLLYWRDSMPVQAHPEDTCIRH